MKKYLIITITLAMIISLCSCSSDSSRIDELEKRVEVLESIVGVSGNDIENNSDINADYNENIENDIYRNTREIGIFYDFNTKDETNAGKYSVLRLDEKEGVCHFTYYGESDALVSDYSIDVYNEILDMICSQNLELLQKKTDANGKIIDDVRPYVLRLDNNYFEEPANMNEILSKFDNFKESSEPYQ